MKKYLVIIALVFGLFAQGQAPEVDYQMFKKYTTEKRDAIDVSDTSVTYFIENTDTDSFQVNRGNGWVDAFSSASIHTFTVEEKSGDFITEVADNSIKIYHSGTGIGDVIFNASYTDYLEGLDPLIGSQPLQLIIYNLTKNKLLTGEIQSLNYRTGGDGSTYYGANMVSDSMTAADIDEGDVVEVQVCVSSAGGGDFSEWASSTGTRAGGNLVVNIGDYDNSNENTEIEIDDANGIISLKGAGDTYFSVDTGTSEIHHFGDALFNGSLIVSRTGFNLRINPPDVLNENQIIGLPTASGVLPLSVNGVFADASGNIPFSGISNNIYTADGIIPDATNRFVDFGSGSAFSIRSSDFKNYIYLDDNEVDIRNGYGTLRFRTGTGGIYDSNSVGDVWTATDTFGNGKWLPLDIANTFQVHPASPIDPIFWAGTQAEHDAEFGIGYTHSDTDFIIIKDATPPTLPAKTNYIYLKDYDIDVTGITSSSEVIQEALDDAIGDYNVVVFPVADLLCKNLTVSENTKIIADGCKFIFGGDNPTGYVVHPDNSQESIFHARGTDYNNRIANIAIQGGRYVGERAANDWSTYAERDCFQFIYVDDLTIKDATIVNWQQDGMELKSCKKVLIENNTLVDIVDAAIEIRGCESVLIKKNTAERTRNLVMAKSHDVLMSGTTVYHSSDVSILDNYGETFGKGFLFNWVNNLTAERNHLKAIDVTGESGTSTLNLALEAHPVTPSPATMENILINNNIFEGVLASTNIRVNNPNSLCNNIVLSNNKLRTATAGVGIHVIGGATLSNNIINNGTVVGIRLRPYYNCLAENNQCSTINIEASAVSGNVDLINNKLTGNINAFDTVCRYIISKNTANRIILNDALNDAIIEYNTLNNSTGTAIYTGGDNLLISTNTIATTGNYTAIKTNGSNNTIEKNIVTGFNGALAIIEVGSGASYNKILTNDLTGIGSGQAILVNSSNHIINYNTIDGGINQGIRINGDNNKIGYNLIVNVAYNGIQFMAGADNNTVSPNIFETTTTNIANAGTGNLQLATTPL